MRIGSANAHVFKLKRKSSSRHNDIKRTLSRAERGQSNTLSAVPSRGMRDERAGASPPNGGPLYDWVIIGCFRLTQVQLFSRKSRLCVPPQAPSFVMPRETSQKWSSFCGVVFYAALHVLRNMYSQRVLFIVPNYILEYTKPNYLKYTVINLLLFGRFVFNPALVNLLLTIVATSWPPLQRILMPSLKLSMSIHRCP